MAIEDEIKTLKTRLSKYSTYEILKNIRDKMIVSGNNAEEIAQSSDYTTKTTLKSPAMEWAYMIGLTMTSEDNSNGKDCLKSKKEFDKLEVEISKITSRYHNGFINCSRMKHKKMTDNEKKKSEEDMIAFEAFSSYFDFGPLRLPEQTETLIKKLFMPFDNDFIHLTGISINDCLDFASFIKNCLNQQLSEIDNNEKKLKKLFSKSDLKLQKFDDLYKDKSHTFLYEMARDTFLMHLTFGIISIDDIKEKFPNNFNKLIEYFCFKRQKSDYIFYDDLNPFFAKSLCFINDNEIFAISYEYVLNSIYIFISSILEDENYERYEKIKKAKADNTEKLFYDCLNKIFKKENIHKNVCQSYKTEEHDFLIEFENYILIAEVKATKLHKPFHNPDKSYLRVKREFNRQDGIGFAYKQAIKLRDYIIKDDKCLLYDNMCGKFHIDNTKEKIIIPIVFTLNQYGTLSINTHNLLDKRNNDPFPWICNWADFDSITNLISFLNLTTQDFIDYVAFRSKKHQFIIASDEMDIFDRFFTNRKLFDNDGLIIVETYMNNIIDQMYYEKNGIPYLFKNDFILDNINKRK